MKKIFQKFFRGYAVLEEVHSPINGKIQVWEDWFGKRRLVVSGISQSGEMVEKLWEKTISNFQFLPRSGIPLCGTISNCLILGLGAGTAAKLVNKQWPEAKIIGIEIDPEMIRLGKKYFGLNKIKDLKIITADAVDWVGYYHDLNYQNKRFDLILVDLYLGDQVPKNAETDEFIKKIQKCLSSTGMAIFNRLYYGKKKEKTDKFGEKLKKYFGQIEAKKVSTNKLFLCQK